jgi:hypothetical protein
VHRETEVYTGKAWRPVLTCQSQDRAAIQELNELVPPCMVKNEEGEDVLGGKDTLFYNVSSDT